MTEPTIADKFNTVDGLNPATVEAGGLLIPWELLDELGVSVDNRDKADAIAAALVKQIALAYPVANREADFNISVTGLIERGTNDVQFDNDGNQFDFDNFTATINLYRPSEAVELSPNNFVTPTT